MTHAYYRDAQALLLLYDVTNQSSFDNIRAWLSEIRQYAEEDVVIMLLGNKVDKANRVITKEQGEKLAKQYEVSFMETSAKTGQNVELAFMAVARWVQLSKKEMVIRTEGADSSVAISNYYAGRAVPGYVPGLYPDTYLSCTRVRAWTVPGLYPDCTPVTNGHRAFL